MTDNSYRPFGALRLALAVLVLTSHASDFLPTVVAKIGLGNVGVMSFFVVSGTVICEALDQFYSRSVTRFLINRCLKIFPAYWAALVLFDAVYGLITPSGFVLSPWALLVNVSLLLSYFPSGNNLLIIDIAWAVVIEIQFYLIVAVVWVFARSTPYRNTMLFAAATMTLIAYLYVFETESYHRFYGAFRFAPFFVLGGAIYGGVIRRNRFVIALAVVALSLSVHSYVIYISQASVGADATFTVPMRVSVVLFIAAIGLFARLCRLPISSHGQNIDRKLGNITYALYLTHPAIIALAVALHWDGHFGRPVTFILVVVGSLLMSVGVFQGVERPVMQLRDSFRGRRLYRS